MSNGTGKWISVFQTNFVGIFLVKVGPVVQEETAATSNLALSSGQARADVSISFTPTVTPKEKLPKPSPTADRKKQLYRSLFDEDEVGIPSIWQNYRCCHL